MAPIEASRKKDHFCSFKEAENGRCPMGKGFVDLTTEEGVENEVEVMTRGEVGSGSMFGSRVGTEGREPLLSMLRKASCRVLRRVGGVATFSPLRLSHGG